jgi:hypothetical protein
MTSKVLALGVVGFGVLAVPALAHHSFAMFDDAKTVEITGTVKEFRWTNPHSWLFLTVMDATGQTTQWAFEMGSPVGLVRVGWKPRSVVPGDKVSVRAHPMRDGTPAGQLLTATLPNGQVVGEPTAN